MNIQRLYKSDGGEKIIFELIMLAPLKSLLILISFVIASLVQSVAILAFVPLVKYLNIEGLNYENIVLIRYFESMIGSLGFESSLITVLAFMVLFSTLNSMINYLSMFYTEKVCTNLNRILRDEVLSTLLDAEWMHFINKKTGFVVHSIITEANRVVRGYRRSIHFISKILQGFVFILATFLVSPYISLLALVVGGLLVAFFQRWVSHARKVSEKIGKLLGSMTSRITDGLHGIKPLKAMNSDRFLISMLNRESLGIEKHQLKDFVLSNAPFVLRVPLVILIVALGVYYVVQFSIIPLVNLFPLILLFNFSISQISGAQGMYQGIIKAEPFYTSLKRTIFEAKMKKEELSGNLSPVFEENITINKISFSYPTKSVLSDVSMVISKNSFIALMGESGAGKTTFSDILCALFTPDSGDVLVDGRNLFYELDIKKWRRMIGYVPQDLFLFHDTIMHNVNLGDAAISREDVEDALKASGAWEFISELSEGIKTIIGERGIRLSGGQRQRLSIARAIVRKPQLLILDEATTALDPATEERILRTLRQLTNKGITIVAVSHQTAVLDIADDVYRLEAGRFVKVKSKQKQGVET